MDSHARVTWREGGRRQADPRVQNRPCDTEKVRRLMQWACNYHTLVSQRRKLKPQREVTWPGPRNEPALPDPQRPRADPEVSSMCGEATIKHLQSSPWIAGPLTRKADVCVPFSTHCGNSLVNFHPTVAFTSPPNPQAFHVEGRLPSHLGAPFIRNTLPSVSFQVWCASSAQF